MLWIGIVLLLIALAAGWLAQVLGLPGNWLIVAAAALYAWWLPPDSRPAMSWQIVIVLFGLAAIGELLEFAAGALGVTKAGGSRRSAVLAIIGSTVGAIVGAIVGLPIPLVGSLAAAILFAGLGALAGAFIGEQWKGRQLDASLQVGQAAFIGRVLGTLAKVVVASVMVVTALAALVL